MAAVMGALVALLLFPVASGAAVEGEETGMAEDISHRRLLKSYSGVESVNRLFDGYKTDFATLRAGASLTLEHEGGIGSLYMRFGTEAEAYRVINEKNGEEHIWGGEGILHEFLDLEEAFGEAPQCVTLRFEGSDVKISEIQVFSSGQVPDTVQKWQPPAEGCADLVLFSTHGDDEQLFFAGLLPYYAGEQGYQVQVVYMTDHRNMTLRRVGEMLDGLWAVGVRNYPVFGGFEDYLTSSREEAYQRYGTKGITEADIQAFVVENIRRFCPKVAVGHDLNGEYGHGMHMVYADALCAAVEISMDPNQFAESAEKYGIWDVPKTYLHLYGGNMITMDWDRPLEKFGGMTAFQVTRDLGFPCHISQQSYYSWYFAGKESAAEIVEYSPCEFGLYRSTVGADEEGCDFFENVVCHGEEIPAAQPQEKTDAESVPEMVDPLVENREQEENNVREAQVGGVDPVFLGSLAGSLMLLFFSAGVKATGRRKNKKKF